MKIPYVVAFALFFSTVLQAQDAGIRISSGLTAGNYMRPYRTDLSLSSDSSTTPLLRVPGDTVQYNMYGNLRDDNPAYNQKSSLPWVIGKVFVGNTVTWAADRYIFNDDWARIGFNSWSSNVKQGFEWDTDRFGMNFFAHPYSGAGYFNSARDAGYNIYESIPFAVGGSLMWEYFGENSRPSYNDIVNTPVTGILLGEMSYRLSSNFLDDRTSGFDRLSRELFAGIINPWRGISRILSGKAWRTTAEEVYQKEPLNLTFTTGARLTNDGSAFGTGTVGGLLALHLDYGNPFEHRTRKPFDYFELHAELALGGAAGRKIVSQVVAYGMWYGKNIQSGKSDMLIGVFQHYDFWDNWTYEIGTIAFGPSIIAKTAFSDNVALYYDAHVGMVPLGGLSTILGPDTSQFRDYNYGAGLEGKGTVTLNLGSWVGITVRGYYYWIHTYVGRAGNAFVGIVKPSVSFRILSNFSLGIEQQIYYSDRYPRDFPNVHEVRTEQKVFLQLYIDNFKQER